MINTQYNFNDIVLQIAMHLMGGESFFVSGKSRLQNYKYNNYQFSSYGLRFPIDTPHSIEFANNKIASRYLLNENNIPVISYNLIDTSFPIIPKESNEWVLKIPNGMKGNGIIARISTNLIVDAIKLFKPLGDVIFIEPYISGKIYRVLILNNESLLVYSTSLPIIYGNGKSNLKMLFNQYYASLFKIFGLPFNSDIENDFAIKYQGFNWKSVLKQDEFFYPTFICNISRGAIWKIEQDTAKFEDLIHIAQDASNVLTLRFSGTDFIKSSSANYLLECNPSPGIGRLLLNLNQDNSIDSIDFQIPVKILTAVFNYLFPDIVFPQFTNLTLTISEFRKLLIDLKINYSI